MGRYTSQDVQVRFFRWNSPSGRKRRVTLEYGSKAV